MSDRVAFSRLSSLIHMHRHDEGMKTQSAGPQPAASAAASSSSAQSKADSQAEAPPGTEPSSADPPKEQHWWNSRWFRVVFMLVLLGVVLYLVLHSVNPEEFESALKKMNPWWFLAAFLVAMVSWIGAALQIVIFAPKKVPFGGAVLTEVASSFVGVVAPAGLGTIALSVRFLTRQQMTRAQAIATLVLVEVAQAITSFLLVVAAIVFAGISPDVKVPWREVAWVAAGVLALIALVLMVRRWREWLFGQIRDVWQRVYPQTVWAFKHPRQLAFAVGAVLLQTGSYVAAFVFSLMAFGQDVSVLKVAAVYLVFNTIGSVIPVPGGVGTIEASLTAGLALIGVPAAVGLSAAVIFRLATFYAEIPLGWVAFEYMERKRMI